MWLLKNRYNSLDEREQPIEPVPSPTASDLIKDPRYQSDEELNAIIIIQTYMRRALTIISRIKMDNIMQDVPIYYMDGQPKPCLNYNLMIKLQQKYNALERKNISWSERECFVCSNPQYIHDPSSLYKKGGRVLLSGVGGICSICGERICPLHYDVINMICIVCEINK